MSPFATDQIKRSIPTLGILAGSVLVLYAVASLIGGGESDAGPDSQAAARPMAAQVLQAKAVAAYEVSRSFVGRVEARRESDVGFELGGMISAMAVDEGAVVAKGDLIASLDTSLLLARRQELISARDSARAQTELASSTRLRVREASELDAVSAQVLDEAELGYSSNSAALAAAESAIATLDVQLAKSELRAPFDALVSARFLDEGQVIGSGTPVFRLLENSVPEVRIGISSDAVEQLQEGASYPLLVGGKTVEGRLRAVLPERRAMTRGIDAVFELNGTFNGIRRGDLAELVLTERVTRRAFELPISALTESARGIWAVYVAQPTNDGFIVDRRQVELLHNQGNTVFVRGTLSDGEQVVAGGLQRLVPGQRVQPMSNVAATATGGGEA